MNIAQITNMYVPASLGGAEVSCYELVARQLAQGHDVHVITNQPGVVFDDPRVINLNRPVNRVALAMLLPDPALDAHLRSVLTDIRPDVVHIHNVHETLGFGVYGVAGQYASVATIHDYHLFCLKTDNMRIEGVACSDRRFCASCASSFYPAMAAKVYPSKAALISTVGRVAKPFFPLVPPVRNVFRPRVFNRAMRRVICPSESMAHVMRTWGVADSKLVVLPNIVSISGAPSDDEVGTHPALRIGYAGKLTRAKGVHILLDAFRQINTDAILRVAGDGPDELVLRERADDDRRIEFLGRLSRDEIEKFYRSIDVLVVPSIWPENLPMVVFEGMARGKAVIVSDIGGMPSQVGKNGLCVPANNVVALRNMLTELSADRERLRLCAALGQKRFEAEFAAERVYPKYEELYAQLAETH